MSLKTILRSLSASIGCDHLRINNFHIQTHKRHYFNLSVDLDKLDKTQSVQGFGRGPNSPFDSLS
jgi:hypothetical protein